ncbi:zinc ribbon domain-containing protein [Methylobacterium sp. WL30]|uniref:zinc ribbon domain-containing protein n=1 Tax=unclassified Methylobacterium TaxID=2615210 RepID=UPI0011CB227B|nr:MULTISPECIES: zinc ribbon domain-containing protein [unclassified Methylobacterium]TXN41541.1 zinc ribbon domain-containing protein [Methylobacterium sp. WL93]TXN52451.1 zinc ribbon domain-containing protein [Methylobacterium sp. WL119]TXN69746.1 zinc ribbon domain-containing protein [Methylobacterium sp. WL30]
MAAGTRLSERWFNAALWLVALLFAGFLIGLGSLVVGDLPQVEHRYTLDQFLDREPTRASADAIKQVRREEDDTRRKADEAQLALDAARSATEAARETFANWLKTRNATQRVDQDPGLVARTQGLDQLKAAERTVEERLEGLNRTALELNERETALSAADDELRAAAQAKLDAAERGQELRVFGYRLALTLPLLVLAGWLLLKRRRTRNWPFVWGFAFAAAFAFFVELVPYLPSYGGYVQYGVGAVLTLVGGRAAINALHAYRERQALVETRPDAERRTEIATDEALVRLSRKVCPGCERGIALDDPNTNFCPHCGLGVFERCPSCSQRKSTFEQFCRACGERRTVAAAPTA